MHNFNNYFCLFPNTKLLYCFRILLLVIGTHSEVLLCPFWLSATGHCSFVFIFYEKAQIELDWWNKSQSHIGVTWRLKVREFLGEYLFKWFLKDSSTKQIYFKTILVSFVKHKIYLSIQWKSLGTKIVLLPTLFKITFYVPQNKVTQVWMMSKWQLSFLVELSLKDWLVY